MKNSIFYIAIFLILSGCFQRDKEMVGRGEVNFMALHLEPFQVANEQARAMEPSEWRHIFQDQAQLEILDKNSGAVYQLDFDPNDMSGGNRIELPFSEYSYTVKVEGTAQEDHLPFAASGDFVLGADRINVALEATTDYGLLTVRNEYVEEVLLRLGDEAVPLELLASEEHYYLYVQENSSGQLQIRENVNQSVMERELQVQRKHHYHFYLAEPDEIGDDPGHEEPGDGDPGSEDPGNGEDPGSEDPGEEDPGSEDPSDPDDDEGPDEPGDAEEGTVNFVELRMGDFQYQERPIDLPGEQVENFVYDGDGNAYRVVRIGNQYWMAENLRAGKYCNGDEIPFEPASDDWLGLSQGVWTYFDNDASYGRPYGKYYTREAVQDERNICPCGWKVPERQDWERLIDFLGGANVAGGKLKSTGSKWKYPNTDASNESGFNAIGGGIVTVTIATHEYVDILGNHNWLYERGAWWSSTGNHFAELYYNSSRISLGQYYEEETSQAYSVRCIKE